MDGSTFKYFIHSYNATWRGERAVEIPIATAYLQRYEGSKVLEVGNVLSHYLDRIHHIVVDKYEPAAGVLNIDIIDYKPDFCFDFIVSISTLEHVGFDEPQRTQGKFAQALSHLLSLLAPDGVMLVTLPIGYNPEVNEFLSELNTASCKAYFFKRLGKYTEWQQTSWDQIKHVGYASPFPSANGLAVCIFEKRQ